MDIVFLGTSDYGEPALRAMVRMGFTIAAVITQPDRKCGRGLHAAPCAIKKAALELGLPVFQPENINDPSAVDMLTRFKPDLLVIIAYGQLLSPGVLAIPTLMTLNVHGSLLPRYRGPAPINWAIINGDSVTGNSLMKVVLKMDAGPVIAQKQHQIRSDDDVVSLERSLSQEAAGLLYEGLEAIRSGKYPLSEQDEATVSYCRKLIKNDGLIDWVLDAEAIRNRMRGLVGWPGTFSYLHGVTVKLFPPVTVEPGDSAVLPGTVTSVSKSALSVACGSGILSISELQPQGKRRMSAAEFIAGYRVKAGDRFESHPA
jgi:methionyl-tRNA formyltransferase